MHLNMSSFESKLTYESFNQGSEFLLTLTISTHLDFASSIVLI